MAEQVAVNDKVVGSTPARGAKGLIVTFVTGRPFVLQSPSPICFSRFGAYENTMTITIVIV